MTDGDRNDRKPQEKEADNRTADRTNPSEGIPMTGEEDPLAEVSDPDFEPAAADFAEQERKKDQPNSN